MKKRIGELLIEAGLLTEEQVNQAIKEQGRSGKRFGEVIRSYGWVSEDNVCNLLSFQLGIPYINLDITPVEPEAIELVSLKMAQKYNLLPYSVDKRCIMVCMEDPLDLRALDDIRFSTGLEVRPAIGTANAISTAIKKHYNLVDSLKDVAKTISSVEKGASGSEENAAPAGTKPSLDTAPIIKIVNTLISTGLKNRASDIHIEPHEQQILIRNRVDGLLRDVMRLPKWTQGAIISRIKIMANLDIAEKRVPQDGQIKLKLNDNTMDLRVSTLPTHFGEKVVLRICETANDSTPLEKLGLFKNDLTAVKSIIKAGKGVLLCAGPTGCGKTSTLYAILDHIRNENINIVTLEDPIEYDIPGINQVHINEKSGLSFAHGLRAILRQDPNVIMVGEMRDGETAGIAFQASLTGHFVLSTLHTNDTISTILRLLDLGVPPYLISSSISAVMAQRLVRRICPKCKEHYEPDKEELNQMGLFGKQQVKKLLYRGKGCNHCQFTGYHGRIGVFEILQITPRLRELIATRVSESILRKEAHVEGLKTLANDCLRKVRTGVTTLEEYNRVIFQDEELISICPSCQEMIKSDFIVCPFCGYSIVDSCVSCGRATEPEWKYCPYCRQSLDKSIQPPAETSRVSAVNE